MSNINIFENRKAVGGKTQVPVWFMRQAGRYHDHYQNIRKDKDFMTMCKDPELATEITMGPINEFGFDAAILFSDLLFPLEQLGLGLSYLQGPPKLDWHIQEVEDLKKLKVIEPSDSFYLFQAKALGLLKQRLPFDKTLLGFVGGPFTLYTYAVQGSHAGNMCEVKKGLVNGLFQGFCEILIPNLVENLKIQAEGGADALCIFDTAAGELSLYDFKEFLVPQLKLVCSEFKKSFPDKKIIYYSKHTQISYLEEINCPEIDVLGVDWRNSMSEVLNKMGSKYFIQGNIDPCWLHLPWENLRKNLTRYFNDLKAARVPLDRWICGLGHGVLPKTPQDNVKRAVEFIHENFRY